MEGTWCIMYMCACMYVHNIMCMRVALYKICVSYMNNDSLDDHYMGLRDVNARLVHMYTRLVPRPFQMNCVGGMAFCPC